jgi:hypothetical protein
VNDTESLRFHADRLLRPGVRDFAVNVWPAQRPKKLRHAMLNALESHRYPDETAARAAIAHRIRRPVAEILLTNGAADAFWLLAQTLRPRTAACIHPSFTEPEAVASMSRPPTKPFANARLAPDSCRAAQLVRSPRARASTCATWSARRPVRPCSIWLRHENPSATMSVLAGASRTLGSRTRSPQAIETS